MQREKIYIERIKRFADRINKLRYTDPKPLSASFIYDKIEPISYETALSSKFKPIKIGEEWGKLWGCAWFKFKGKITAEFKGKEVGALIDLNGEACVWKDGSPWLGLTNKIHWDLRSGKYFVPLAVIAKGGEEIDLLVEAGANGLFGAGQNDYRLQQAEIVCVNRNIIKLNLDLKVLINLFEALEERLPRRSKIIYGLNEVCNVWNDGKGIEKCLEITAELLSKPANASALTIYSIGHAHLDLAWLWPVRETIRKGGRTFATALKMLEKYPEYKFGASQPQLYEWIKTDYPQLYAKVKQAIADGRWEVQGAMWVEPDMNLTSGESLVRQCLYGKRFYQDEFGKEVKELWLPDVFGYSAALPQILKKCGIDYFMTQKISWNETNIFPHHTFMWEGIDGTRILSHFLPTNNYNLSNTPKELIESEKRYAQSDVSDEFLNLYGIGDGGGGPSAHHIEMGLRQQNLEGTPKFKFSFAEDFYKKIDSIPKEKLPLWSGELYLELHRGTYTTQAMMKKYNRLLEQKLHNVEFLGSLVDDFKQSELDEIWKNTLLNQFHDILPGSSINWVYKDANKMSRKNLDKLDKLEEKLLIILHGKNGKGTDKFVVYNSQPWKRKEVIQLAESDGQYWVGDGTSSEIMNAKSGVIDYQIELPPCGYTCILLESVDMKFLQKEILLKASENSLENKLIKIEFAKDGTIVSMYDKVEKCEILAGKANELLLREDEPNNWGAWDVNHFYRETTPEKAKLISSKIIHRTNLSATLLQQFKIGNSDIEQKITITENTKLIKFENKVDWKEEHKMLRVSAQLDIYSSQASFEIQYGTLKRATHSNTSWDAAKFEVVAQRFADLSQPDYGFAILNDCKYGHYIKENVMSLNLLRSPKDTDKEADLHLHEFTFCYYPHKGSLIESDTLQLAHNLNSSLIQFPISELPENRQRSFYNIIGKNVKLEVIKKAEDGNGIILRMYETAGTNVEITFQNAEKWEQLIETDMLENAIEQICKNANEMKLQFKPFEIKTFRIV
ncbi:MAG: glycoside hydrolase family 38 C-terminal domain-containing protein [Candidatus Tenebribacter burtonii]|nr:glycoside hydrolase family 38 C-terminal domain-containing protein [Candidatus Tenebribacter burtonii]